MLKKRKKILFILLICISAIYIISNAFAIRITDTLKNVELENTNGESSKILFLGEKAIAIFYTDVDEADIADPILNKIKGKNYSKEDFAMIYIANIKYTWQHNAAIRRVLRRKAKQYKMSALIDAKEVLEKEWGLGSCKGKSVVIVVGKDKKVKYVKEVESQGKAKSIKAAVIKKIDEVVENE